jgi:hypothetical protein
MAFWVDEAGMLVNPELADRLHNPPRRYDLDKKTPALLNISTMSRESGSGTVQIGPSRTYTGKFTKKRFTLADIHDPGIPKHSNQHACQKHMLKRESINQETYNPTWSLALPVPPWLRISQLLSFATQTCQFYGSQHATHAHLPTRGVGPSWFPKGACVLL